MLNHNSWQSYIIEAPFPLAQILHSDLRLSWGSTSSTLVAFDYKESEVPFDVVYEISTRS